MRLKKSIPQQREFHTEHGRNLRPYYLIANLGQLLSAASLALAVFSILSAAIAGKGMSVGTGFVIAAAVVVGIFIELANRTLARPAIKPAVVKDQFVDDEDADRRHRILTRWSRAGLLLVGSLSFVLSYMGSVDASEMMATLPPLAPVDSLQMVATTAQEDVQATFAADTAVLLTPFTQRQQAARQQFEAIKAERTKAAEQYASCADKGNKWCKGNQRSIFGEIDAAEATLNATLATIATERGATLARALQGRDDALKAIAQKSDSEIALARDQAGKAETEAKAETSTTGAIFAVLTFAGQLVFYLMFYLILHIEAGSKITENLEPNEFSNLPSVWSDFKATLSHRVERGARRFIAYVFGERERLEAPLPYVSLYPDAIDPNNPTHVMSAEGIAPELVEADPVAANHAPGFYRKEDDPHNTKESVTPLTHLHTSNPTQKTVTTEDGKTLTKAMVQSRVKQYRQRLGNAKSRARVQQRKMGKVNGKTANAITNNQTKLEYFTGLLKQLK